jgi:hypothetical protein
MDLKDLEKYYKNPLFYYVLAPSVLTLWPLFLWLVYLPATQKAWAREQDQYTRSQPVIDEILSLDPERLHLTDTKNPAGQFDYATAIQKVASLYHIPPASYKLASGMLITTSGQKSQSARVSLKDVNISQVANFLSTVQLHWPDLQCNTLKVSKRKDSVDSWDADFDFKYFF